MTKLAEYIGMAWCILWLIPIVFLLSVAVGLTRVTMGKALARDLAQGINRAML